MKDTSLGGENVRFLPTPWTLVLRGDAAALDHLARVYWKPIYFFIRRKGHDVDDAKDLTQEFWATMLQRAAVAKADPARGRFRTFLLAALQNFLRDEARAAGRQKRGPPPLPLEAEPPALPPEDAFMQGWARELLRQAVEELKPPYLDAVKRHLAGEPTGSEERNHVHRGRAMLRDIVVSRIRESLDDPAQLEAEIAEFLRWARV
jgi:RNA polymerase sigma-70 factor (ECF subfamily)